MKAYHQYSTMHKGISVLAITAVITIFSSLVILLSWPMPAMPSTSRRSAAMFTTPALRRATNNRVFLDEINGAAVNLRNPQSPFFIWPERLSDLHLGGSSVDIAAQAAHFNRFLREMNTQTPKTAPTGTIMEHFVWPERLSDLRPAQVANKPSIMVQTKLTNRIFLDEIAGSDVFEHSFGGSTVEGSIRQAGPQ